VATERLDLPIGGMTCAACASRIERVLRREPGVISASVNLATEAAVVTFDPGASGPDLLARAIVDAGFEVRPVVDEASPLASAPMDTGGAHVARVWALAGPLLVVGMTHGAVVPPALDLPVQATLATLILTWGARPLVRPALAALRHGAADMNVLVLLGAWSCWGLSVASALRWTASPAHAAHGGPALWFESAGVIVAVVLLGRWLEGRARANLADAVGAWRRELPGTAHRERGDGSVEEVPLEALLPGDRIRVGLQERVPIDGIVRAGRAEIDERSLTGEPMPVLRTIGDRVHAGTRIASGDVVVAATAVGRATAVARIQAAVLAAQADKPALGRLADRAAGVFTPVVLVIAALAAIGAWAASDGSAARALEVATTVLVVACPCALGLATPTALLAGTARAAKQGLLVQNAAALERLAGMDLLVFDKTGTLTSGAFEVTLRWSSIPREAVAAAVAGAPRHHPIAEAIARWGAGGPSWVHPTDKPGSGVQGALADGRAVRLGSRSWLLGDRAPPPELPSIGSATESLLEVDGEVVALFTLRDPIRPEAAAALTALRARGVAAAIVSGDHGAAVSEIGAALGVHDAHAGATPEDKSTWICSRRAAGRRVGMIGDGVNDAPALAAADVSFAIPGGSELAAATADVALLRADLSLVPTAIDTARATVRTIRLNLLWAFGYNALMLPLAAGWLRPWPGFHLSPMWASAAMAASSVSVVLSSLALRAPPRETR
jgi:Cu+-exporting ATPase